MSTIAAISTAPGMGGIGIVRISGENAFNILEKIFIPKTSEDIDDINGYKIKYGHIIDPKTNSIVDEVLVSYFRTPKSYTTENMCEINSHGSFIAVREILELCLQNGAELAEPGEFTKRAFLNGRIDLTQAEGVADIINSRTKIEARAAVNQLEGFLSKQIKSVRQLLLDILVDIEANIDYPEYDIEEVTEDKVRNELTAVRTELNELLQSFEEGKIIREGIKLTIIGSPNVGKSSLLNAMLKEERAIVTDIAGTTRDAIEESIIIKGIPFKITDTAGIRNSENLPEKIGIEKAKKIAADSDAIIVMFDSSKNLNDEDREILDFIKDKKAIIVLNKIDLNKFKNENNNSTALHSYIHTLKTPIIEMSVTENIGIDGLYDELVRLFNINEINFDNENIVTNVRHKNLIEQAIQNIQEAENTVNNQMPIDIIAINIKDAIENLSKITGENVSEDIINEIFAKFCLGK